MKPGILYGILAFVIWGLFPLYFKALKAVSPLEIMLQRALWAFLLLLIVQLIRGHWRWLADLRRRPRVLAGFAVSALLLSFNWYIYIWAVNNGRMLETSLGYFINPLVNMLLGFVVLHERPRAGQWIAIGLAACGVAWMTWKAGYLPWIALSIAVTFGVYGLLRKTAALGALEGLTLETLLLMPIALAYLAYLITTNQAAFSEASTSTRLLLAAGGPLTVAPMLLFAGAVRRLPLSLLGVLQYIAPTITFLMGVLLFSEPLDTTRLTGFAVIWAALIIYSVEGLWQIRSRRKLPKQPG